MMNIARAPKLVKYAVAAEAGLLASAALAGCSTLALSPSQTIPTIPMNQQAATRAANASWSRSLMRIPLPSAGCFKASYPSMTWERIACSKPPDLLRALASQALFSPGNELSAQRNSNMPDRAEARRILAQSDRKSDGLIARGVLAHSGRREGAASTPLGSLG